MAKKIFVTGGAGFIGSAVARRLIENSDHKVLVFDALTYAGNLDNLASIKDHERFYFVQGNILDGAKVRETLADFQPDIIMHLAAESHVDRSIDGPRVFLDTNIIGTYTLLQEALHHWRKLPSSQAETFRFHHISTDEVFGSLGDTGFFNEQTAYDPRSPYSSSKAASDHLVRAWFHTYNLPVVLSNCSNNYGPFHFPEKLIPLMIINGLEGKPLPVYGAGNNVRDWLYVDDHADALILVATKAAAGATYAIGGHNERKNIDVVKAICSLLDKFACNKTLGSHETLIQYVSDRPGHDARYAIDASKIEKDLGWKPKESFESGLEKTVRWYLDNRHWWERVRSGVYQGQRLGIA